MAAAKLRRAAARKKAGRFLAEGKNAVTSALEHGRVLEIFVTEAAHEHFADVIHDAAAPVSLITSRAAEHLSETVTNTGIFALCDHQLASPKKVLERAHQGLSLVAVPVETSEPGNAGTLIRVADACGAAGVIFAGHSVDPQGGKAVRASAGSLFHVPVARGKGVAEVIDQLHEEGFTVLATAMDGETRLDQLADEVVEWTLGGQQGERPLLAQPTAWLFGNEAHGLGEWLDLADVRVSIPMHGQAESLNLSTAASICLYESAKALSR